MTVLEAKKLIEQGLTGNPGTWADVGAGTGMFTKALMEVLEERGNGGQPEAGQSLAESRKSRVYAVDKSPHALWALKSTSEVEVIVLEADFNNPLDLPLLDGIVMANALHYAKDHLTVLKNVLRCLKPGGSFILVEYETETPRPPWVPNPVSFRVFEELCTQAGLIQPEVIGTLPSQYDFEKLYAATTRFP